MGELLNYYVVLSIIEYDNDPLKFGRVKCNIPGVVHTDTTDEDAMPWVRPFVMSGYQTFSRPVVGQKVWVLISKTNYNEYWWYPFHETTDLVQSYLNEHYDSNPDVFNARVGGAGTVMFTYDDDQGYVMKIGNDGLYIKPNTDIVLQSGSCRSMLIGGKQYSGCGDDIGSYEPCVMGNKCKEMRNMLSQAFDTLAQSALSSPYTTHLSNGFKDAAQKVKADILGQNHFVN